MPIRTYFCSSSYPRPHSESFSPSTPKTLRCLAMGLRESDGTILSGGGINSPSQRLYIILSICAFLGYLSLVLMGFFSSKNRFSPKGKVMTPHVLPIQNQRHADSSLPVDCNRHGRLSRIRPFGGEASCFEGRQCGDRGPRCTQAGGCSRGDQSMKTAFL